jgi:hypothetical protein
MMTGLGMQRSDKTTEGKAQRDGLAFIYSSHFLIIILESRELEHGADYGMAGDSGSS